MTENTTLFTKITTGYVIQRYQRNDRGRFTCTYQEFVPDDNVKFENPAGKPIAPPDHDYQPYHMALIGKDHIIRRLCEVLTHLDTGGEQSRQFAAEINTITTLLQELGFCQE